MAAQISAINVPLRVDNLSDFLPGTTTLAYVPSLPMLIVEPVALVTPVQNNRILASAALTKFKVIFPGFNAGRPVVGSVSYQLYMAVPSAIPGAGKTYPDTPPFQAFERIDPITDPTFTNNTPKEFVIPQGKIRSGVFYFFLQFNRLATGINPVYTPVMSCVIDLIGPPDGGETPGKLQLLGDPAKTTITKAELDAGTVAAPPGYRITIPDYPYPDTGDQIRLSFGDVATDQYHNDTVLLEISSTSPRTVLVPIDFIKSRGVFKGFARYQLVDASGNAGNFSAVLDLRSEPNGPLVLAPPIVVDAPPLTDDLIDYADASKPQGTAIEIPDNPGLVPYSQQIIVYINGDPVAPAFPYTGGSPFRVYVPLAQMVDFYRKANNAVPALNANEGLKVEYSIVSGGAELGRSGPTDTFMNLYVPGPALVPGVVANPNLPAPHVHAGTPGQDVLVPTDVGTPVTVSIVAWAEPVPPTVPTPLRPAYEIVLRLEGYPATFRYPLPAGSVAGQPITFDVPYDTFFGLVDSADPVNMYYEVWEPGKPNFNSSLRAPITVPTPKRALGTIEMLNSTATDGTLDCRSLRTPGGVPSFMGRIESSPYLVSSGVTTVTVNYSISENPDGTSSAPVPGAPFAPIIVSVPSPIPAAGVPFAIPYSAIRNLPYGTLKVTYTITTPKETSTLDPAYSIDFEVEFPVGNPCTI